MFNPFSDVNWQPNMAERRRFGWSLVIGFPLLAIALLLVSRMGSGTWRVTPFLWLGGSGMAAGAVFVAIPSLARPFYLLWYFLSCCIGAVVGNTILTVFYLLILTPIGATMRAFGRRVVSKTFDKDIHSYWVDVEKADDVKDYYRQF
jgi:thiol:disulfide interchange protein